MSPSKDRDVGSADFLLSRALDNLMKHITLPLFLGLALTFTLPSSGFAAAIVFNSAAPASNSAERTLWLASAGTATPDFLVDFESGFADSQNVSGIGLFPGGLIISSNNGSATIESGAASIGGSNPVMMFALEIAVSAQLVFDFSASPVDYVGFQDIDQAGTNAIITFVGGMTQNFSFETTATSGDSAEFIGVFRNDMPRIVRLQFTGSGDAEWAVDNIEYGVVPEPATVTLVGMGLLGARLARRKRRSANAV